MDFNICRICGDGGKNLKIILDNNKEMVDKLLLCANIKICPGDMLPKLICVECEKNLELSYRLRKQSDETQKRLRQEMLMTVNSNNTNNKQLEQNLCPDFEESCKDTLIQQNCLSMEKGEIVCVDSENDTITRRGTELDADFDTTEEIVEKSKICNSNVIMIEDDSSIEYTESSDDFRDTIENTTAEHLEDNDTSDNYIDLAYNKTPENHVISEQCSIDILSSSRESLNTHLANIHCNEAVSTVSHLTCDTCHEVFSERAEYSSHIKQHGDERYQCIQCCKFFPTLFRLKRHEETHNEVPFHQCSYCKRSYRALYNLKRHIESSHLGKKSWDCSICNVSFSRADILKRHLQLHSEEKNYKCSLCSQSFKTRDYLYAHNKSHHNPNAGIPKRNNNNKKYSSSKNQCGHCGKVFNSSFSYKNHLLIHTNEKPYECETCHKKYRTLAALSIHQRIHDDYRPYQCDVCLKSFRQTAHLNEHKLLHSTNERQHTCTICQAAFAKKGNLKAHLRIHTKEKPFKCADCSAEFNYLYLLQRHASKVHNRSAQKVYTINDTDKTLEPYNANGTLESEEHIEMEECDEEPIVSDVDFIENNEETYISSDEELNENAYNDFTQISEHKAELFVTEETKLISSVYDSVNKLE